MNYLRRLGLTMIKLLCLILFGAILLGGFLGVLLGLETISALPSLRAATSRAILAAKTIFQALQPLGLDGLQALILSLGLGIFFNNALTVMIILLSPIPILRAKQFSDEHLAKLYYEHGIWLFKPMGWRIYRALSLILPLYALGLQFYLIGGALALHTPDAGTMIFLAIEAAAISFSCVLALLPGLSGNPLQHLKDYTKALKLATPIILACLFAAAILESHQLLLARL
ncbi:MAG: hypothetical protein QXN99_00005 [Nitrososphaerota archaeon]